MALVEIQTYSEALQTKTNIRVILPTPLAGEKGDAAYRSARKYPVLYLLHGTLRATRRIIMWPLS